LQKVTGQATGVQRGAIVFLAEESQDAAAKAVLAGAAAVLMRRNMTPAQWETQAGRTPAFGTTITGLPLGSQMRPTIVSLSAQGDESLVGVENGTQVRIVTPAGESQSSYTYNAVGILPG